LQDQRVLDRHSRIPGWKVWSELLAELYGICAVLCVFISGMSMEPSYGCSFHPRQGEFRVELDVQHFGQEVFRVEAIALYV
jgi:hypothetical protein